MIVDEFGKEITDPDLKNGYLIPVEIIKPEAMGTIDNVTKFAYQDDDFISVMQYIPISFPDALLQKIESAKSELESTDYVVIKCIESVMQSKSIADAFNQMTKFSKEYCEIIERRKKLREDINNAENEMLQFK